MAKQPKTIKDAHGNTVTIGDFIAYNKPMDFFPTIGKVESFTRTNTPRIIRNHREEPFALIFRKCYYPTSTSTIVRNHKLYFVKIEPTPHFLNKFFTNEIK